MRRFGERIVRGKLYRARPGIYAIIHDGRDLLITEQSDPMPEYQLPGGGIDNNEHPIQALHREVLEETGWRIAIDRRLGVYQRFCFMPEYDLWARKICQIYVCRAVIQKSAPSEAGHSAIWATPAAALRMLDGQGDRHMLQRWLRSELKLRMPCR